MPATDTSLADSRSVTGRSYRLVRLIPGQARLIDRTPAAAVVTITKGKAESRYLIAVVGRTPDDGLVTRWQKPDGTLYVVASDGVSGSCDCPACCWEATARADRRHRTRSGSLGCAKLDALAHMVRAGSLPAPPPGRPGAGCPCGSGWCPDGFCNLPRA
jgi:hypothetical protein